MKDARHLTKIDITGDHISQCPWPRPTRCDQAPNWGIRPRWHSTPHRGCVLR